ncbi:acyltransferase [Xylanimonas ulmi]|uniref:Acetyltransferase-like isoleucine patch superfamily enzyme n=1 Tax=Xylanimonas ulmi TaxID=228973 RepID=A0A4Q7M8W9_9MICO|nr:acyltransferase [Xylanibacterium ulmi]RZS62619.1 acetyltransferase-like isoleucine patch superfamily enzyme [Xylanibacterium ulmi]
MTDNLTASAPGGGGGRWRGALRSLADPRVYLHALRLAHFSAYAHVRQVRLLARGPGVQFAPNVSFRNAERITLGAGAHVGEHSVLWAGNATGRIVLGDKCLLGPHVTLTASNYRIDAGTPVMDQPKVERDIVLGRDVWLGANVVVTAGVTIGDEVVVGAGAVVTRDLPSGCVAVGAPARVIGWRPGHPAAGRHPDPPPRTARVDVAPASTTVTDPVTEPATTPVSTP